MNDFFEELLKFTVNQQEISRFRRWHVEALLNQGADLTDRCLDQLRELRSLYFAKVQFEIELDREGKNVELESKLSEKGFFDRNREIAEKRLAFLKEMFDTKFASVYETAHKVHEATPHLQNTSVSSATIIAHEKTLEYYTRQFENNILGEEIVSIKQDVEFNKEAVNVKKLTIDKKSKLQTTGVVSSFQDQIDEVEKRIIRDYEDALVRLYVAQNGLKEIYGTKTPLPNKPKNPISELSIWNREAIEFIVAYQQLDQAFTKVLSIRGILGEVQWNLLANNQVSFGLSTKLFSQHENVRFRGIGASIIGKAGIIPWSLIVTLPGKAVYKREGVDVKVSQDDLPSCLIGKVENRNSFRAMEYCGTVSLMNASPIGQSNNQDGLWRIGLEKPEKTAENFSEIDDIVLEISVVGQPI